MFYTATVKIFFEDEKGRRKSRKEVYLVNADTVSEVETIINQEFQGSMQEFQVVRVAKSNILDVFQTSVKNEKK